MRSRVEPRGKKREMSSSDSESGSREEEAAELSSEGEQGLDQGEEQEEEEDQNEEQDGEEEDRDDDGEGENVPNSLAVATAAIHRNGTSTSYARSRKSMALSTLAFPISRVRRLVKSEVDVQWVGMEAGFLIAKATELFLENLVESAFEKMTDDNRTSLSYKDVASHVSSADRFDFLSDFVPEPISASTALTIKMSAEK